MAYGVMQLIMFLKKGLFPIVFACALFAAEEARAAACTLTNLIMGTGSCETGVADIGWMTSGNSIVSGYTITLKPGNSWNEAGAHFPTVTDTTSAYPGMKPNSKSSMRHNHLKWYLYRISWSNFHRFQLIKTSTNQTAPELLLIDR